MINPTRTLNVMYQFASACVESTLRIIGFLCLSYIVFSASSVKAAVLTPGPMLGAVTDTSIKIWVRSDVQANAIVQYQLADGNWSQPLQSSSVTLIASNDFTGIIALSNLASSTTYDYRVLVDGVIQQGSVSKFRTLPAIGLPSKIKFAFGSDLLEGTKPFDVFYQVGLHNPDLMLFLGDNMYLDNPDPLPGFESNFWTKYKGNRDSAYQAFANHTPIFAIWDNHDYGGDAPDKYFEYKTQSRAAFGKYWPNPTYVEQDASIYYNFRAGDAEFFALDSRWNMVHGVTMLGAAQLTWLKNSLLSSSAKFKFIVSPVTFSDFATAGYDTWKGFPAERTDLVNFITQNNIKNVVFLTGDQHWTGVFLLDYPVNQIGQNVRGFYEFLPSPLSASAILAFEATNPQILFKDNLTNHYYGVVTVDSTRTPALAYFEIYRGNNERIYSIAIPEFTPATSPIISNALVADGNVGNPYSQTLQTSGGTTPFQWSITSGALPPGLILSTNGVIAGTPSQLGVFNFSVKLQDSALRVATANFAIGVTPPPQPPPPPYALSISSPSVQLGVAISTTWFAPAGSGVKDWVGLFAVGNPNSIYGAWTYTNGATSGTFITTAPTTPGTYEFRYLLNSGYTDAARSAPITVTAGPPPPPLILTSSLVDGNVGQPYSQTLQTSGGTTPFQWSITSGALPPGLTLNQSGVIAGTPSQLGIFSFSVRLQDSALRVATASLSINVTSPPASPYALSISAASVQPGAAISTTWTAPAGSAVKDWVALYLVGNSNSTFGAWTYTNGATSGMFNTTAPATPGTYEFRYLLNNGYTDAAKSSPITVAVGPPPPPVILTTSLPNGNTGQPYSQTVQTSGGSTPFQWSITSGALPPGLTLNAGGVIAGTSSQVGVFNFTVRLQDSALRVATADLSITVTVPPASPYALSISAASVQPGAAISTTWTAPAGSAVKDWVALYLVGNPNSTFGAWTYTNGATSGTFNTTAPATPGTYEFRYLLNNGYTDAARSAPITVIAPPSPYALSISASSVQPGAAISTTWTAPGGSAVKDWVGLFLVGNPNSSFGAWIYTNGATSGTFNTTAPVTPGTYEFRYLLNNGYTDAARSAPITVR